MSGLALIMLVAACDGRPIGRENATDYFEAHRAALNSVVAEVERCQPAHGRLRTVQHIQCSNPNASAADLFTAMSGANAIWVYPSYNRPDNGTATLNSVRIGMYATGSAVGGEIEEFVYQVEPASSAEYERDDDGIAIRQRQPLTDAPHHWYWWKIDR
ncbi:MAG: hypothetical protein NT015_11050 [Alphaproteobacteria bacterium]|nr:hypothetical protein [Alphaproteobacteria bacterium]